MSQPSQPSSPVMKPAQGELHLVLNKKAGGEREKEGQCRRTQSQKSLICFSRQDRFWLWASFLPCCSYVTFIKLVILTGANELETSDAFGAAALFKHIASTIGQGNRCTFFIRVPLSLEGMEVVLLHITAQIIPVADICYTSVKVTSPLISLIWWKLKFLGVSWVSRCTTKDLIYAKNKCNHQNISTEISDKGYFHKNNS